MAKLARAAGRIAAYAAFAAIVGYFSIAPAYHPLPPDQAVIKLSFSHPGQLRGECRERSAEELERLPPNMRQKLDCPRERSSVAVELTMDGRVLHSELLQPSGFSRDGMSTLYRRFQAPAGGHLLRVCLRDSERIEGYNYEREETITLQPAQVFVIDFKARAGGFIFQ